MTKDEALDLALYALKELVAQTEARLFAVKHDHVALQNAREAITAIKQARSAKVQEPSGLTNRYTAAQPAPVQEPVAGQCRFPNVAWSQCDPAHVRMVLDNPHEWKGYEVRYLYTTPPAAQRQWVGLMQGVRVEREYVVVSVHGGNGAARKLCEALIQEMNT